MRKIWVLFLALAVTLILGIAGCGKRNSIGSDGDNDRKDSDVILPDTGLSEVVPSGGDSCCGLANGCYFSHAARK